MRIIKVLIFCCLIGFSALWASHANQPGHFGLGVIVGEPTGLSGKYAINNQFAVQGALGGSIIERGVWFGADFLIQFRNVFTHDGRWPLYVGGGLVIQDRYNNGRGKNSEASLGLRAVVGVEFHASDRISIFGEASAQPFIIPSLGFGVGLGLGVRYWF